MVRESEPELPQGTTAYSRGPPLMSGFLASVYGEPEESNDIAEVPEVTEVMEATRLCTD